MTICSLEEGEMCGLEECIFEVPVFFTSLVCESKHGKILCVNVEEF